jgi:hypothetical protein
VNEQLVSAEKALIEELSQIWQPIELSRIFPGTAGNDVGQPPKSQQENRLCKKNR